MESRKTGLSAFLNLKLWGSFLLLMLPLVIFRAGYYQLNSKRSQEKLVESVSIIQAECENLKRTSENSEEYFCARIREIFFRSFNDSEPRQHLVLQFLSARKIKARVLLWDNNFSVKYSNFAWEKIAGNWPKAFETLHKYQVTKDYLRLGDFPEDELINLRNLFGAVFFPVMVYQSINTTSPNLCRTSMNPDSDLLWICTCHNGGLLIFIDPKELAKFSSLKYEIGKRNVEKNLPGKIFLIEDQQIVPDNDKFSREIEQVYRQERPVFRKRLESKNLVVINTHISEKISVAGVIEKNASVNDFLEKRVNLLTLVWVIFAIFLCLSNRLSSVFVFKLKFKHQLILLFLLSSIFPMLGFASIALDYVKEYKASKLGELHRLSFKFLQNIAEFSIVSLSDQINHFENSLGEMKQRLAKTGIDEENVTWFFAAQKQTLSNLFLIGSQTEEIAFERGIISKTKILKQFDNTDLQKNSGLIKQARATDVIFKSVLAELNGVKQTNKQGLELEMVFDSLAQSDPVVLKQSYFESLGSLWKWGFGETQYTNYIRLLSVFTPNIFDYNFLAVLNRTKLSTTYIEKYFHSFNRNGFGLKLFVNTNDGQLFPKDIANYERIKEFITSVDEKNSGKSDTFTYEGEKYLATALYGINNSIPLSLVAMYPISNIENDVRKLSRNFFLLCILSGLVTIGLSLAISRSVVEPIGDLKTGVQALTNRNFSFRLPDLGNNEFGNLAKLFNRTLIDMEELMVAGFVQEKLIPQLSENLVRQNLLVYGRTESLNDLGGDYFDIIEASENQTGIILGDVAGHGVAASMIMAFMKACVIRLKKLYDSPLTLINKLNDLLRVTRNKKQRKFMSFQYLVFDNENGSFQYVNAGHCFPIIVDAKKGTADFLSMINSPLGTSSKAIDELQEYKLDFGQSVVLYSDGYYEIPGMSLEKFRLLLIELYDSNPKTYFDKIVEAMNREGFRQEDDDKTLLIVSRKLS